jgi:hypothetical protein
VGASRRRIDRRLSRAVVPLPPVAATDPSWFLPVVGLLYALGLALVLLSADQLAQYMPGAWFEALGAGVLLVATLSVFLLLRTAWRRQREQLGRRALLSLGLATLAALVAIVAIVGLVENAQIASVISGADVRFTRPVIDALPRPAGTKLLDETPGIAGTESISQDFSATDLNSIVPFYEQQLSRQGWVEDKTSAATPIVRFTRGDFILSVAVDPPSGDYTLTVDRALATPSASPSSPAAGSPSPS